MKKSIVDVLVKTAMANAIDPRTMWEMTLLEFCEAIEKKRAQEGAK